MSERTKNSLRKRIADNQKNTGTNTSSLLDLSDVDEVNFFKPVAGKNKIDILPYVVGSNHHPQGAKKGDVDYILDIYIHKRVGIAKTSVLCLNRTLNKPCPICEEQERLIEEGQEKLAENLKATRRGIYNVVDLNDEDKGIQIFNSTHYFFEKEMLEKLKTLEDEQGEGSIIFADPEDGRTIVFRATEETYLKSKYLKFKDFEFAKRKEQYEESIMEETFSLDAMLTIPTYDEVKQLLYGVSDEDGEDEDSDVEEGKETPTKKRSLRKRKVSTEDVEAEEEEEPEPEEEEVVEEKPTRKPSPKKAKKSSGDCPHGHEFAKDCDDHEDCKECEKWDDCVEAYENL